MDFNKFWEENGERLMSQFSTEGEEKARFIALAAYVIGFSQGRQLGVEQTWTEMAALVYAVGLGNE